MPDKVASAVVARGKIHASRLALEESTPSPSEEAVKWLAMLTRQQGYILQLVCAARMNKQIAYELSVAETTVKAHVTAIMRKLGVQTRMQAVLFAQEASFAIMVTGAGRWFWKASAGLPVWWCVNVSTGQVAGIF